MNCETVDLGNGQRGIVCGRSRRRRCKCGRVADRQCDWRVPERSSGTCDAFICSRCSTSPAPEKDICPAHRPALEAWQARLERER